MGFGVVCGELVGRSPVGGKRVDGECGANERRECGCRDVLLVVLLEVSREFHGIGGGLIC